MVIKFFFYRMASLKKIVAPTFILLVMMEFVPVRSGMRYITNRRVDNGYV